MELIHYIDGLFIDVPSIPDYCITYRLNTEFRGHASIWYPEMEEAHGRRNWLWWKSQIIQSYANDDIANTLQDLMKRTNIGKYSPYKSNCGSTDHYANNCPKEKNNVYAIEKFPEEDSPTGDSESDSMGGAIREQSDEYKDPREEFLVEYHEDTPL
ncbi:hypothetical protein O181_114202 [Austropuccinia psidii MF-1]|uniref:Uncharacterized protein n=1 Tax=Austropuccinia psidii MF-1 TaxID=1389203 RepID=A0A9Q3K742_9BASI|nr:hypothetical protein [Austropuccinia psidii MF-1]